MKRLNTWILGSLLVIAGQVSAENIYVLSSGTRPPTTPSFRRCRLTGTLLP
jgi:hypothetical protein